MKIGGQSGIKREIARLMENKNITIIKIKKTIPKIKRKIVSKYRKEKNVNRAKNLERQSIDTILSDYHAEIRNYRQLLSYLGVVPPEIEGYKLNEISELLCISDSKLTMAIWEHQKIKLRYSNPFYRPIIEKRPSFELFNKPEDFSDFNVNPYLAIIEILRKIQKRKVKSFFTFEEYKYFLCREAPFDSNKVINKILFSRKNKNIIKGFRKTFAKSEISSSANYIKEMDNLIYGISSYEFIRIHNKESTKILKYNYGIEVINDKLFSLFADNFIDIFYRYILPKYKQFYENLSIYSSLKFIDEIISILKSGEKKYESKFLKLKEFYESKIIKKFDTLKNFYNNIENYWIEYISKIDPNILIFTYSYLDALEMYPELENLLSDTKKKKIVSRQYFISDSFKKIIGSDKNYIKKGVISNIFKFYKFIKELSTIDFSKLPSIDEEKEEAIIQKSIDEESKKKTTFEIKKEMEREILRNPVEYEIRKGIRTKKRWTRFAKVLLKERLEKHIVMEEYRPDYPIKCCDSCNKEFRKDEPQWHHIIPKEILGPDHSFNSLFLCKKCHKIFTFRTQAHRRIKLIRELKEKDLVSYKKIESMIIDNVLYPAHLDFLRNEKYISLNEYLNLKKVFKRLNQ